MVTTRSADKRVDAVRDEDLVLRSRTIGSPESTPTQSKKRIATGRTLAAPSAKRTRTTTDAVLDIADDSHKHTEDEHNVEANNATKSPREEIDEAASTMTVSTNNGATPRPKVPVVIVPPPPGSRQASVQIPDSTPNQEEHFQTPATSRHRRFDSEEINEEIMVVSHGTDDYETAEEVIEDSDEAPEIEVTKTSSASTKRRKPLMPKLVHRPSVTAVVNSVVDDEPAENDTQDAAPLMPDTIVEQGEDVPASALLQPGHVDMRQPPNELPEPSQPVQPSPAEDLDPSTETDVQNVPDPTTTNIDTITSDTQEPAINPSTNILSVDFPTLSTNELQAEITPSPPTSPHPENFPFQQDFVFVTATANLKHNTFTNVSTCPGSER
ncbi:hypothetical protein LTS08_003838 [Lithohypha guttulata]|uniref:uncharacterized protein n=1 Tax=Lithohypha guttulata TaxID=1690604 RepID=UPI002DE07448|nr:hypothetical protein LTR51_001207 [Lithohypha guttulata]KAK5103035.1 hypothetical protein LTS08_003838 [Lithohypha guttulata]